MKKLILAFALVASGFALSAQNFNIGLGGGVYSTWLINKNVSDQGDEMDFGATFGGQFGLNTQYYFKENIGISLGILISSNSQKYTGDLGGNVTYDARTKLSYLDLPLLLRLGGGAKGAYFEFGPQFGFIMSAKDEFTTSPTSTFDWEGVDRKNNFKGSNIAGVLGFGVDIDASENIVISTGLRLGYGFTDVTKEIVELKTLPAPVDDFTEFATDLAYGITNSRAQYSQTEGGDKVDYSATNRAFGGLFISVMYKIPAGSKSTAVPSTK